MIKSKWTKTKVEVGTVTNDTWKEDTKDLPTNLRLLLLSKLLMENIAVLEKRIVAKKKEALENIK